MNDFTKDELELMYSAVKYYEMPGWSDLTPKILSLIDNYCEPCPSAHEFYEKLVCEQCGEIKEI